jgi:hypothetical protein
MAQLLENRVNELDNVLTVGVRTAPLVTFRSLKRPETYPRFGRIEIIECDHLKYLCKEHLDLDVLINLPKPPPRRS